VRRGMNAAAVAGIGAVDLWYGVLAGLILVVGFSRAVFAAKGWFYYQHNGFFWAKIATFAVIGLLSVPPTIRFIQWRRAGISPPDAAIATLRRYLYAEVALFAFLPIFAAAMARGYGEF
jgi:putative membrane protein